MPIAAVPAYLGNDFKDASPGMRFGMYLRLWGVNNRTRQHLWTTHDVNYRVAGRDREERDFNDENKVSALTEAKRLGDNDKKTMQALIERQKRCFDAVASSENMLRLDALATAPFTTGLGNEHPLENGFAFLNPYGLPYLPGSGIKGVLRQAARELASGDWDDPKGWDEAAITNLFGRESGNGDTNHLRGALVFWDVIPQLKGDSLMVEIMTPHQSHYYQWKKDQGGKLIEVAPHESGQPTPISFLTVPPGSGFTFHVQCNLAHLNRLAPELAQEGRWKTLLEAAFKHAFHWLGFGAKTAVGYGAMRPDLEAAQRAKEARIHAEQAEAERRGAEERQARLAAMSSNMREVEELRGEIESRLASGRKLAVSDQFWGGRIKKLAVAAAESAEWTAEEKSALADMLENCAGRLMALDAKDLRKQLKLSALRGLA